MRSPRKREVRRAERDGILVVQHGQAVLYRRGADLRHRATGRRRRRAVLRRAGANILTQQNFDASQIYLFTRDQTVYRVVLTAGNNMVRVMANV